MKASKPKPIAKIKIKIYLQFPIQAIRILTTKSMIMSEWNLCALWMLICTRIWRFGRIIRNMLVVCTLWRLLWRSGIPNTYTISQMHRKISISFKEKIATSKKCNSQMPTKRSTVALTNSSCSKHSTSSKAVNKATDREKVSENWKENYSIQIAGKKWMILYTCLRTIEKLKGKMMIQMIDFCGFFGFVMDLFLIKEFYIR